MPIKHCTTLLVAMLLATIASAESYTVYIGTYTRGDSEGIYRMQLDAETGTLSTPELAVATENPSFLALHPTLPVIYAAGEVPDEGGTVSAFAIDAESGDLTLLNRQSSEGAGPCHVAVAPSGEHVAVANYSAGSITLLPLDDTGALQAASATATHEGSSAHPQRQQRPHAHSVVFAPKGDVLLSGDLGIDKLMIYRYDAAEGGLPLNDPPHAALAPGAGPRHLAFHPNGKFVYVVNELDNTVTAFAYDAEAGRLENLQTVGTLPEDFTDSNTTAEIRVHPNGQFLYASNRGHHSLAHFQVDPETGALEARGHTPTGGETPRNFNISPDGNWLITANQNTDNVLLFHVDSATGALHPTQSEHQIGAPVCVLFTP